MPDYMQQSEKSFIGGYKMFGQQTPYIQVGQNYLRQPTSMSLQDMYKVPKPSLPSMQLPEPTVPGITPEMPEGGMVPTTGLDINQWLDTNPDWTLRTLAGGLSVWMPATGQPGDYYLGGDDELYEWVDGDWKATDNTVEANAYKGQISKNIYHTITWTSYMRNYALGVGPVHGWLIDYFSGRINAGGLRSKIASWLEQHPEDQGKLEKVLEGLDGREKAVTELEKAAKLAGVNVDRNRLTDLEGPWDNAYINNIKEQLNAAVDKATGPTGYVKKSTLPGIEDYLIQDFGTQVSNFFERIHNNELSIFNEYGLLDVNGLRAEGGMGDWVADTLENAISTGYFQNEMVSMAKDAEGNAILDENGEPMYLLSDELTDVLDNYDESIALQQSTFMRDLRISAAQRGIATTDVAMVKRQLAWRDEATMQAANNLAQTMSAEMETSYKAMGNSIVNMLKQAGKDAEAAIFESNMLDQMESVLADYNVQMQIISEEVSQGQAAASAQIFQAFLSAAAVALMMII